LLNEPEWCVAGDKCTTAQCVDRKHMQGFIESVAAAVHRHCVRVRPCCTGQARRRCLAASAVWPPVHSRGHSPLGAGRHRRLRFAQMVRRGGQLRAG
jgi:hypothetical protein